MPKLYKVFVSSTYEDLRSERLAVKDQLLKDGFLPVCQELFCADAQPPTVALEHQIKQCDYLVVLVGSSYGTPVEADAAKRSFTEWECDYALDHHIPVLAFFIEESRVGAVGDERLVTFRKKLESKTMRIAVDARQLQFEVARALREQKPREGWVRARHAINVSDESAFDWNALYQGGYYATCFVCRLRHAPDGRLPAGAYQLSFAIQARVIPVREGAPVYSFGLGYDPLPPHLFGARISYDRWKMGGALVDAPGQQLVKPPPEIELNPRRRVRPWTRTSKRESLVYSYACTYVTPLPVLEDDHEFTFYADSIRVEAELDSKYALQVHGKGGTRLATETFEHEDGLATWVADDPNAWAPEDRFTWRILARR